MVAVQALARAAWEVTSRVGGLYRVLLQPVRMCQMRKGASEPAPTPCALRCRPHTLAEKRAGWERPWLCEAEVCSLTCSLLLWSHHSAALRCLLPRCCMLGVAALPTPAHLACVLARRAAGCAGCWPGGRRG